MKGARAPYPNYRDTTLSWLDAVPAHWCTLPNRALFTEAAERGHPAEELLSVTIGQGVVPQSTLIRSGTSKDTSNDDRRQYKLVRRGDLAYNKMRMWQGAVGCSDRQGIVSPAYIVVRPRRPANGRYYHYLFRTPQYVRESRRYSYGIHDDQLSLRFRDFRAMTSPVPPPDEQKAIVRFIDQLTEAVERFVDNKQRLIEVLGEHRQAVIDRATTHGLNGDVRCTPSGVEWLGEVPEHWTVQRMKFVTHIRSGQVDPRAGTYADMVLIAPNHIEGGTGQLGDAETAREQGAISGKYLARAGEVLYSKIRPALCKAVIAPYDCLCSADMYPVAPNLSRLRAQFLLYLLLSPRHTRYLVDCSMRVAMPKVNREALGSCWVAYPSVREQDDICRRTSAELSEVGLLVNVARRGIALIREYQTRVIADAVTGKLDVRNGPTAEAYVEAYLDESDGCESGVPAADDGGGASEHN